MSAPKKWKKEEIRHNLETRNEWLYRGLMAIYNRQTADEKNEGITKHDNSVGFSGCDSNSLSRAAQYYQKRGSLPKEWLDDVRSKMLKYSGQLAKIANNLI